MILTDRSRHFRGLAHCNRARYYEYHHEGFGIRPRSESIPLATGTAIHEAIEPMLRVGMVREPTHEETRLFITSAVEQYRQKCSKRGFQEEDSDSVSFVIAEQSALIAGLAWAFYRVLLPWVLDEFEILAVEAESELVLGCTCGLGDLIGSAADHDARPGKLEGTTCQGVALMVRPDFIARRKSDGAVGSWDLKSTGYGLDSREHEHWVQLALSSIAAEKLIGERCTHSYLIGLLKGKRDFQSKADREDGGLKKQASLLCYGWYRPADPPFGEAKWSFEYTREKGFGKVPIWEKGLDPLAAVESWVMETLPRDKVAEQLSILGPSQRMEWLEPEVLEEFRVEAERWHASSAKELFPRSWDCYRFSRPCEFLPLCIGEPGSDDPVGSGRYVRRQPHHAAEMAAAKAAGWVGEEEANGEE